jgi:hypothetical protein
MSNQRSQIEQDERVKEWKNERYQKRRGEKSSSHALKEPQTIQNLCICFEIRSTKIEIRTSVRFNAEWTDPLDNLRRMKEAILKRYEQNPRCCPAKDSPLEPDVTRQSHEHETYEEDVQLGRGNRCCGVESFWTNELLHFRIHNSTNLQKNERVHRVKNQVWQSDDNRRTVSPWKSNLNGSTTCCTGMTGSHLFGWRTLSRDPDVQFTRELSLRVAKVKILPTQVIEKNLGARVNGIRAKWPVHRRSRRL